MAGRLRALGRQVGPERPLRGLAQRQGSPCAATNALPPAAPGCTAGGGAKWGGGALPDPSLGLPATLSGLKLGSCIGTGRQGAGAGLGCVLGRLLPAQAGCTGKQVASASLRAVYVARPSPAPHANHVAAGAYGRVFHGTWHGSAVAVKASRGHSSAACHAPGRCAGLLPSILGTASTMQQRCNSTYSALQVLETLIASGAKAGAGAGAPGVSAPLLEALLSREVAHPQVVRTFEAASSLVAVSGRPACLPACLMAQRQRA